MIQIKEIADITNALTKLILRYQLDFSANDARITEQLGLKIKEFERMLEKIEEKREKK